MLYDFRCPRTRPWDEYVDAVVAHLTTNDETLFVISMFRQAQELRQQMVPILEEAAREGNERPQDVIRILEQYIPLVDQLSQACTANTINLTGKIDIVWTSMLAGDVNSKTLSHSFQWELVNCYMIYGLQHYLLAHKRHRDNRMEAQQRSDAARQPVQVDPFEPPREEEQKIYDDISGIQDIIRNLKRAAGIWKYIGESLMPVHCEATYGRSVETNRESFMALCNLALSNAQEFTVQLAVQTGKSASVTSKLSQGVSKKCLDMRHALTQGLGPAVDTIHPDFKLYISVRSQLYSAIAQKYMAAVAQSQDKYGNGIMYLSVARKMLQQIELPGQEPAKRRGRPAPLSPVAEILVGSVQRQLQTVDQLHASALSDNNNIYYDPVPASSDGLASPDPKFLVKADVFQALQM